MKTRNEAALEYLDRNPSTRSLVPDHVYETIRAALTHEDAPVGEVGDAINLNRFIRPVRKVPDGYDFDDDEYDAGWNDAIKKVEIDYATEVTMKLAWEKRAYQAENELRTHSQQKDVGKLVEVADIIMEIINECAHYIPAPPWEITYKLNKALAAIKGETK